MTALREATARAVRAGDVVVDLGCGTGILSFLACEAGARRVYAIEREHLADVTSFLARHLRYADRITVLHDASTSLELPEPADVLLTETIGSAGLDENILGFVIDAKKRLLRDNATIVPRRIALVAAPIDAREAYEKHIGCWGDARIGFDFSPLRVFASNSMLLLHVKDEMHVAEERELVAVDLATVDSTLVDGSGSFVATRDGVVHGFALWFHATLIEGVTLSNRERRSDSWAQAFFPLEEPVPVTRGTAMSFELQTDDGKSWRWRGAIGDAAFDQTTWLNRPPCIKRD